MDIIAINAYHNFYVFSHFGMLMFFVCVHYKINTNCSITTPVGNSEQLKYYIESDKEANMQISTHGTS